MATKRSHVDDIDVSARKKHIAEDVNGSPRVNGSSPVSDEPVGQEALEHFRKEAIYRRMKHYSRENDRNLTRIAELEKRKSSCEAGLAAISACWTQLVETIRLLTRPEDLPPMSSSSKEAFDVTLFLSENPPQNIRTTLEESRDATQNLVHRFVQLGSQGSKSVLEQEAAIQCLAAQSQCAAMKADLDIALARLRESNNQREDLEERLADANNRCERIRSETILAAQPKHMAEDNNVSNGIIEKPEIVQMVQVPQTNGSTHSDVEYNRLFEEKQALDRLLDSHKQTMQILEQENKFPTAEAVTSSPYYIRLAEQAATHRKEYESLRYQILDLQKEIEEYRSQLIRDESLKTDMKKNHSDLNGIIALRDRDILRLREARDQQAAELNERRAKEGLKAASLQDLKVLSQSRADRIVALQSELKRYKVAPATRVGDEDLVKFLIHGHEPADIPYSQHLKEQLAAAQNEVASLKASLSMLQDRNAGIARVVQSESDIRKRLAKATVELEKYRAIYGQPSSDTSHYITQLENKEEELKKLRLISSQHEQSETAMYAELDNLSSAWETLEKRLSTKAAETAELEEKLSRSILEKAKLENKYIAISKEKDAIEADRKSISKITTTQDAVIDKLRERNVAQLAQLSKSQAELENLRKANELYDDVKRGLANSLHERGVYLAAMERRYREALNASRTAEKQTEMERERIKELEVVAQESSAEVQKLHEQLRILQRSTTAKSSDNNLSDLMKIVKCTTCNNNLRTVAVSKCGHTFCKPCIDDRISSRQRKCPSCNLPFAASDIITLYFQ